MPQFELEKVGPNMFSGFVRGRSAEEAVVRMLEGAVRMSIVVLAATGEDGWQDVLIDQQAAGRVRLHQRMRFRRD